MQRERAQATASGAPAAGRRNHPAVPGLARLGAFLLVASALAALFVLSNPTIPSEDGFRHFRQAALYARHGLFMHGFPWLPYSAMGRFPADMWYGFHLWAIPFTFLREAVLGIKLIAVADIVALLLCLAAALRRHRVAYWFLWPFVVLFFSPPILYGLLMTRPVVLTAGLCALLFSFVLADRLWGALLVSAALASVDLSFFWAIPVISAIVLVTRGIAARAWSWKAAGASLLGLVAGWMLRPDALQALPLEGVQLFLLAALKRHGPPIIFSLELSPVAPAEMLDSFALPLLVWGVMTAVFVAALLLRRGELAPEGRSLLLSSLAVALFFCCLTTFGTRRAAPFWVVFVVLFLAAAFSRLLDPRERKQPQFPGAEARLVFAIGLVLAFGLMAHDVVDQHLLRPRWRGAPPYRLQAAGEWLRRHTRPGDMVFNAGWGTFNELFFWSPENHYDSGIDPVFLYAYDQQLYWKAHHLWLGETTEVTCGMPRCRPGGGEDTYTVLRRDFKAVYVMAERRTAPALYDYLRTDPRFIQCFDQDEVAIYRL